MQENYLKSGIFRSNSGILTDFAMVPQPIPMIQANIRSPLNK